MEIKTLVIIGFILTLLSSGLYFYINIDTLMNSIKLNRNFNIEKRIELNKIDTKVSNELKESDLEKLKKELEALKNSISDKKEIVQAKLDIKTDPVVVTPVDKKEPFLINNNIFLKQDRSKVCKALFNSEVATKEQLNESFNNGANWCNYGWTDDGNAYYPLQNETNTATCKGTIGLNGGTMADKDYKLGIICYGVKPDENKYTDLNQIKRDSSLCDADQKLLDNYRKQLQNGNIKIAPFNDKSWSRYSYKNDTLAINDKIVVSTKKECSNDPQTLDINKSKIQAII